LNQRAIVKWPQLFCYTRYLFLVATLATLGAVHKPERIPLLDPAVTPVSYDLTIAPRLPVPYGSGGKADGSETIVISVAQTRRSVVLNSALTTISTATIDGRSARVTVYPVAQQIVLDSGSAMTRGRHTLALRFVGRIFNDVHGLWSDARYRIDRFRDAANPGELEDPRGTRRADPVDDYSRTHEIAATITMTTAMKPK
jgi:hypothetical protein